MRTRWFLGGLGLGVAVGALAVWALTSAAVATDGRGAVATGASASDPAAGRGGPVPAHRAPPAGVPGESEGENAAAARPGSGRSSGRPTGDRSPGPRARARAESPSSPAGPAPGSPVEQSATGEAATAVEWERLDDRPFALSGRYWSGGPDTRTREHVKSLLQELGWGRPAPLQEGPSGAARLLAACRSAAEAHVAANGDASAESARGLLGSTSVGAATAAIGLADRGAFADVLAAAARDGSLGAWRYAAVLSIAERCPDDAASAEAVIALTRSEDIDLRGLAAAVLSRLGRRGQDEASERLVAGDFHLADLVGFAPPAMAGSRRAEVISALRDPSAVLACCAALRGADFRSPELAPLAARLPAALDPVFTTAEGHDWVGFAADVLAGAQPSALVAIASSSRYPLFSRTEAFDRAYRWAGSPEASLDVAARVLASDELSRDVLGTVLGRIGDEAVVTPRFTGLLRDLAARARDPWAREEARRYLQRSLPGECGGLTIHAAVYGDGGRSVDVADALRARCALGRLVETSGNHLGGDPVQGAEKSLRIEYSHASRRFVQTVPEGQAFHLP